MPSVFFSPHIRPRKPSLRQLLALCVALPLSGCGGIVGVPLGTTTGPPPAGGPLTGNWQIAATTSSGTQPFSALTGSIVQEATSASGTTTLVSVLQAQNPSQCYIGQPTVPSQGNVAGSSLSLTSFSVDGQYLALNGTTSGANNSFTGTFAISGGCGNGVQGAVSGIRIAPFTGTYAGTLTGSAKNMSLTVMQDGTADGFGYFHVQGSGSFTGIPCFTSGTLISAQSTISGQEVVLTLQTNESPSSLLTITGTLSPAADALTVSSLQVLSGGCSGTSGSGTLVT